MVERSQKIRLGIFVLVSMILLISTIAIITGSKLFKRTATYYIRYKDISLTGLEIGSTVKYRGIRVGRINDIYIDPKDITSVIVEITVQPDVPIKVDTEAVLTYIGITGLKIIELQGGTNEADYLLPGEFISSGQSLVDAISGQAEIIMEKLELILNNFAEITDADRRDNYYELVDNASAALGSVHSLIDTNQSNIFRTVRNLEKFTNQLELFINTSNATLQDINEITGSGKIAATVDHIEKVSAELERANLSELIAKLTQAVEQTNQTFTHLDLTLLKSRHDILSSTEILRESLEYFNEFTRLISENPSLLLRSSPQEEIKGP
ncbi:MCE family protein [candidate division KSB1 bacterium]|nr:MCE family protein [candidate division KSB1 bacterium]